MTPQPRHIEAAEKIVEDLIVNGGFVLQRYKSAKIIAIALAEAENRAAWRVWGKCETLCDIDKTKREISEDYGPRPSRGEVKHE